MAGHSHWAGIKHKKEISDKKRGKVFAKLLMAVSVAARDEENPDFNPRLRDAIEKAKKNQVPRDAIERAVARARESLDFLEELLFEAYGPAGAAILIEVTTDSRNRSVSEIKKLLQDHGAKWAESGSVRWAFEEVRSDERGWRAKFDQEVEEGDRDALVDLARVLLERDDVQSVHTNVASVNEEIRGLEGSS